MAFKMDFTAIFLVAVFLVSQADAQALTVDFDNSETRHATVGQSLKFICKINRGLLFVIENYVEIVHLSHNGTEKVLVTSGKLTDQAAGHYDVKIPEETNSFSMEFDITEVRDEDEGFLVCRVKPGKSDEEGLAKVEIVVLRPLDSLHLTFDDLDPISQNKHDPIEIDAGEHSVMCSAEGSNPAPTSVSLFVLDEEVRDVQRRSEQLKDSVIKFRTTITKRVHLSTANTHLNVKCMAHSQMGDSLSVSLPIKIKVYDPKIECNDSEAYKGKYYPVLSCTVHYEGLKIKGFKYELGKRGSVEEGMQNKEFVEVKREQLTENSARVHLNLYQAENWHFDTEFYLVAESEDGHKTRESVRLHEIPGPGSGSSMVGSSVAAFIFSLCAVHMFL